MKKFNYIFILGALLLSVASCEEVEDITGNLTPQSHFIDHFVNPRHVYVSDTVANGIVFGILGENFYSSDGESFTSICNYYGDTSYNSSYYCPVDAVNDSILSVSLTTVTALDENYPAGSDISELAQLSYVSFYDYIKGGYQKFAVDYGYFAKCIFDSYEGVATKYTVALTEIKTEDTRLTTNKFLLEFKEKPNFKGKATLKFTITYASKGKASISFNYNFV